MCSARQSLTYVAYLVLLLCTAVCICPHLSQSAANSSSPDSTQLHIMLFDTTDKNCYSDVINTAVQDSINKVQEKALNITIRYCGNCTSTDAQNVLFGGLFKTPNEVAIIGPACYSVPNAVAQISRLYQIPLISLAPSYHDGNEFLFTIYPTLTKQMDGVIAFIDAFPEWHRVAIISQDEEMFRKVAVYVEERFSFKNISVVSSKVISRATLHDIVINKLVENSFRIVILNMESKLIRRFLCKASLVIQYQYVWITLGSYEYWWLGSEECDDQELQMFLNNQSVMLINTTLTSHTDCNKSQSNDTNVCLLRSLAQDSVMAIINGLNETNTSLVLSHFQLPPGHVREVGPTIAANINEINFRGFSGDVSFTAQQRSVKEYFLFQFKNESGNSTGQFVKLGLINCSGLSLLNGKSREHIIWGDTIPSDGSTIIELRYTELAVTVVTYIFAGCNIIIAIAGMLFMTVYKKRRLIRLSSPNLNYLVGIGVIIFNTSVFLFVYPPLSKSTINIFCVIRPWFTSIGYLLCLGTINTKMLRVYYVCRNAKATARKRPLKDWHLFLFVSFLLLIDVIILTLVTSFPTSRQQAKIIPDVERRDGGVNDNGIPIQYTVITCEATYRQHWLIPLLGYKAVFHFTAVFLAFKIRKVKVKVLNDSKEIVFVLYLTGLVLAAAFLITLIFRSYLNVYTGTYAVGICLASAVILGVVFVSKAIHLCKDPKGLGIFPTTANNANTAAPTGAPDTIEIANLQRKVKTLESKLTTIDEARNDSNVLNDKQS
ncbi:gamma-aminobutyric acid type B receptor subunit 2-like isoform X2 [Halichondria panicea]|uniref:gamma-aminobutyric acid type B receptor subunit 2-like isoform X2 n=1 Tax=Halichondria panicea TaxID=6063 RepID=UPI00312B3479